MVDREINRITVLKRVVAKTEGTESDDKALFRLFFLQNPIRRSGVTGGGEHAGGV